MLDPVKRMFAELAEADGKVRVRYHPAVQPPHDPQERKHWVSAEREMTYRNYMLWLNDAHANGTVLEWVETIRGPAT